MNAFDREARGVVGQWDSVRQIARLTILPLSLIGEPLRVVLLYRTVYEAIVGYVYPSDLLSEGPMRVTVLSAGSRWLRPRLTWK